MSKSKKKKYLRDDPYGQREALNYDNPIPSREYIMQYLEEIGHPTSLKHIYQQFEMEHDDEQAAMLYRLKAMVRDGQLMCDRRGRYCLLDKLMLIAGSVVSHAEGYGHIVPDDGGESVYLSARQMRKVFHGDRVLVRPSDRGRRGRLQGEIHEVLEHKTQQIVGRYICENGHAFVLPDNKRLHHDIHIAHDGHANAQNGDIVIVDIVLQPRPNSSPVGKVVNVLGQHMAPGLEIDIAMRSYGLPFDWPQAVLDEVAAYSDTLSEEDCAGRADLRDLEFVTIDGADARDFDDAVFCQPRPKGGWRLYVAIADVSHYVKVGSTLDQEAYLRGTSVYFPERVIPMLPPRLSDDLCSLRPKVDRPVMVCDMAVSPQGKLTRARFYPALIHSHARLTYDEVAAMLVDGDSATQAKYAELLPALNVLYELYKTLSSARQHRGALDFDTVETSIVFNDAKKIEKIVPIYRNDAHRLIEECMLLANVATAKFLLKAEVPALYRVHDTPGHERLDELRLFLAEQGLELKGGKKPQSKHYSQLMQQVRQRPDAHIIQTVVLRSMNQAVYSEKNIGHFGLAYKAYTHFTSPIRRYPDLLVHRAIRHVLSQQKNDLFAYSNNDCHNMGRHCSDCERRADEATRDVVSWLKCEYLSDQLGEVFPGVISAVTSFGIFVELKDIYVEGLVHVTGLKEDYYQFDSVKHRLVGERTRTVYRLGDQIKVQVVRVDLDNRKIDFDLHE